MKKLVLEVDRNKLGQTEQAEEDHGQLLFLRLFSNEVE